MGDTRDSAPPLVQILGHAFPCPIAIDALDYNALLLHQTLALLHQTLA